MTVERKEREVIVTDERDNSVCKFLLASEAEAERVVQELSAIAESDEDFYHWVDMDQW